MGAVLNRTIDVGFALTVDHRLPAPDVLRSTPLRAEPLAYAVLPAGHPLAGLDVVDPGALAAESLHLPRRDDNPDIHDLVLVLVLEMLADSGLPAPHLAPPYDSAARRQVHLEIVWHRDTDALAIRALTDQLLTTPELTSASQPTDATGPRTTDR